MKSLPTQFLDLQLQFCETIINGWSCFVCIVFVNVLLMKPNDFTGANRHIAFIAKQHMHRDAWLAESCRVPALWWITTYNLLSDPMHIHCDVTVGTSKHNVNAM